MISEAISTHPLVDNVSSQYGDPGYVDYKMRYICKIHMISEAINTFSTHHLVDS